MGLQIRLGKNRAALLAGLFVRSRLPLLPGYTCIVVTDAH